MITIIVNVDVNLNSVQDFIEASKRVQIGSLKEDGCLKYHIFQNMFDSTKFTFLEEFKDEEAINIHKTTKHFQEWVKSVENIAARKSSRNIEI